MEITSQHSYYIPILESIKELGGKERTQVVIQQVYLKMKPFLKPDDNNDLPRSKETRFQNSLRFARQQLIEMGMMKSGSPHGIWEISQDGMAVLRYFQVKTFPKELSFEEKGLFIKRMSRLPDVMDDIIQSCT